GHGRGIELVMKSVLCVISHFPPDAATGAHRARAIARHLPAHGWRPVVVSPRHGPHASQDLALLKGLPEDLVVYRTPAPNMVSCGTAVRDWAKRLFRRPAAHTETGPAEGPAAEDRASGKGWTEWASWWLQIPDMAIGWVPSGCS